MGLRAIGVIFIILSLNASAVMMAQSGMNDHLGIEPTGGWTDSIETFDKSSDKVLSGGGGFDDYIGLATSSIRFFWDGVLMISPAASAFRAGGFPQWFVSPLVLLVRVIYWVGLIQLFRGAVFE